MGVTGKACFLVVFVIGTFLAQLTSAQVEEKYSGRYDNLNIDLIFSSRLLKLYVDCLLDRKPCAPEGKELKRELIDAAYENCVRKSLCD